MITLPLPTGQVLISGIFSQSNYWKFGQFCFSGIQLGIFLFVSPLFHMTMYLLFHDRE